MRPVTLQRHPANNDNTKRKVKKNVNSEGEHIENRYSMRLRLT